MIRKWKPGDVAIVRQDGEDRIALRGSDDWVDSTSGYWTDAEVTAYGSQLVVIDPDDPYEVERFVEAYHGPDWYDVTSIEGMQEALRAFANPTSPKPDEPQGLGAVVEVNGGVRYVRLPDGMWASEDEARPWNDIPAVRVLSEGVNL